MEKVWKLGASKSFADMVKVAMGKKLTSDSYIKVITMKTPEIIKTAKARVKKLSTIKPFNKKIDLKAKISLVHGKLKIADNKKGFETMADKYKKYLLSNKS
jgi:hypothetical protein